MCVVAVCLYMVCREDNSPHMLIDFSGTRYRTKSTINHPVVVL